MPSISLSDYLQQPLPPLNYDANFDVTDRPSSSKYGRTPQSVQVWEDLQTEVDAYLAERQTQSLLQGPVQVSGAVGEVLTNPRFLIADESMMHNAFDHVLLDFAQFVPKLRSGRHSYIPAVKGEPDHLLYTLQGVATDAHPSARNLVFTIEVKCRKVLGADLEDLAAAYRSHKSPGLEPIGPNPCLHVEQAYGYLVVNNLGYGCLTTYDKWWFFKRDPVNTEDLYISRPYYASSSGPNSITVRQVLFYLASLAPFATNVADPGNGRTSPRLLDQSDSPKPDSPSTARRFGGLRESAGSGGPEGSAGLGGGSSGGGGVSMEGTMVNAPELECSVDGLHLGPVIGMGRSGKVFRGAIGQVPAAIKFVDSAKTPMVHDRLQCEVSIYGKLQELQGNTVPLLLSFGNCAGGQFGWIALEEVAPAADQPAWSREDVEAAKSALRRVHEKGILHGDIRPENFIKAPDRMVIVDFEHSEEVGTGAEEAKNWELAAIDRFVGA
ncbi:hypothetical protein HK097_008503 [Rhizophlyctis rosea]|uniref:Protein kinase domain-containing protein n=1 Tax=Rhizophlyctis rosea TaxID=64517 RepID=A0AAD5X4I9_9FUNG|nr:hypothetical protein HK097_008503 [Rhizophlyctis rosea]